MAFLASKYPTCMVCSGPPGAWALVPWDNEPVNRDLLITLSRQTIVTSIPGEGHVTRYGIWFVTTRTTVRWFYEQKATRDTEYDRIIKALT